MTRVGVVGAGLMGCQLAGSVALRGQPVVLVDVAEAALATARSRARAELRDAASAGGLVIRASELAARVVLASSLDALADCDVIVECTREELAAKRASVAAIAEVAPRALIAVNTSCVPIARLAEAAQHPERIVGAHFMNPIALRPVVEVIVAPRTAPETLASLERWLAELGKRAVVVSDAPGFVSNRVLMLMVNEAVAVLEEGTADAATIDRVFTECMGHATGPLATIDLIGVDTVVASLEVLEQTLGDPKFRPRPLLRRLVAEGRLGRKTGRGFHDHE